jgi:hypothetical protein
MTSSIAACSAIRTGCHQVMMFAAWPRRMRLVRDAMAASLSNGLGLSSAPSGWK